MTVATNLHHLSAQIQIIKFVCVFKEVKLISREFCQTFVKKNIRTDKSISLFHESTV